MQTEMMLRLLRKDTQSKSEYRIVGYEAHLRNDIIHMDKENPCPDNAMWIVPNETWVHSVKEGFHHGEKGKWIDHDAFDRGIKVGNDWWFEGDIFLDPLHGKRHQIIYDTEKVCWMEICEDYSESLELFAWLLERAVRMERIGNIHEARTMEGE